MLIPADTPAAARTKAARKASFTAAIKPGLSALLLLLFVLWAHLGSGFETFQHKSRVEPGWEDFRQQYNVDSFGEDGYFTRAVRNGYNLIHHTYEYGRRFTRKTAADSVNSCSACHSSEEMAYALVNGDRFDTEAGRRLSFEENVMRCYARHLDGFVPTIYDPAVRDIRIFSRAVAHHLQLSEGSLGEAR